jgi:thioredoxin 2
MSAPATSRTSTVTCPNCGKRNRVPAVSASVPKCGNCHQPLPWIAEAGDDDFADVAERSPVPALVDLWATWCGPCRMVSPALERLAEELAGNLKLVKVNADENPAVSRRFEVRSIPTLVLLDHGKVVDTQIGAVPEHQLRSWLESKLPPSAP